LTDKILNDSDKHLMRVWGSKIKDENIFEISVKNLNISSRLDIIVKQNLAEQIINGNELDLTDYFCSIDMLSGGSFSEPGQPNKNSFKKYVSTFIDMVSHINNKTNIILPINSENEIYDGSHRLAVLLAKNIKKVKVLRIEDSSWSMNYGQVARTDLQKLHVLKFIKKYLNDQKCGSIMIAWPATSKIQRQYIQDEVKQRKLTLITSLNMYLSKDEMLLFILHCYHSETWVGDANNNFNGLIKKFYQINSLIYNNIEIYIFKDDSQFVDKTKRDIRELYSMNNNHIHSGDNFADTIMLVEALEAILKIRAQGTFSWKNNIKNLDLMKNLDVFSSHQNEIGCLGSTRLSFIGYRSNYDLDLIHNCIKKPFEYDFINDYLNLPLDLIDNIFENNDTDFKVLGIVMFGIEKNENFNSIYFSDDKKKIIDVKVSKMRISVFYKKLYLKAVRFFYLKEYKILIRNILGQKIISFIKLIIRRKL